MQSAFLLSAPSLQHRTLKTNPTHNVSSAALGVALSVMLLVPWIALAEGRWVEVESGYWDEAKGDYVERKVLVWDSFPHLNLKPSWRGGVNNQGQAHGKGTLEWRKSDEANYGSEGLMSRYVGELKNGMRSGRGKIEYKSGARYDGEWKANLKHGQGEYFREDGSYYKGEFQDDQESGKGVLIATHGEVYEGSFQHGKKHGSGTTRLPSGKSYASEWIDGKETDPSRAKRERWSLGFARTSPLQVGLSSSVRKTKKFHDTGENSECGIIAYRMSYQDGDVKIEPDCEIWEMWKEGGILKGSFNTPAVGPLFLDVTVQNDGAQKVSVVGGELQVESSKTDLQPYPVIGDCVGSDLQFEVGNDGWGVARECTLEFSLERLDTGEAFPAKFEFRRSIGNLDKKLTVDLTPQFREAGVDVELLKSDSGLARVTERNARKALGRFARFDSNGAWIKSDALLKGKLSYTWTDSDGQTHRGSQLLSTIVEIDPRQEKGAGGPAAASFDLLLKLDQRDYRLPFAFRKNIGQGEQARICLELSSRKSSYHRFRAVLRYSDGSTLASPFCRLHFFMPRGSAEHYFSEARPK